MVRKYIFGLGYNVADFLLCREVLRKHLNPALFFVFNVAFISLAQSILLFLITTPTYVMVVAARLGETMSTSDVVFARALMGLVLVEVFADQQQWSKFLSESCQQQTLISYAIKISKRPRSPT
jgi:steroid 5-alpha reductase family enzyme